MAAKPPPMSQDEIQRLLEENFLYIKTVADHQNLGRIQDINSYLQRLQSNLMLLAAVADNQPTPAAPMQPAAMALPPGMPGFPGGLLGMPQTPVPRPALVTSQPQRYAPPTAAVVGPPPPAMATPPPQPPAMANVLGGLFGSQPALQAQQAAATAAQSQQSQQSFFYPQQTGGVQAPAYVAGAYGGVQFTPLG